MMRAYPVASRVHGEEVYDKFLKTFTSIFKKFGIEVHDTILDVDDVSKAKIDDVNVAIIAFLTGGTSKLARVLAVRMGSKVPILLLAHNYHNSLASALSVKNKLLLEGFKLHLSLFDIGNEVSIEHAIISAKAVHDIYALKVLHLNEDGKSDEAVKFEDTFGCEVIPISKGELKEELEKVSEEEVQEVIKRRLTIVDRSSIKNVEGLKHPIRLYVVSKRLLGAYGGNALTVECFPFILEYKFTPCIALSLLNDDGVPAACEADFKALLLLKLAHSLTGLPGWIGNPSDVRDNILTLAHCTVALKLTSEAKLLSHFETGYPCAIGGRFSNETFTLTAISYDYKRLAFARAKHIASGTLEEGRCRTQTILEVQGGPRGDDSLVNKLISNHHVLMVGDVRKYLRVVADLLGMEIVEY